MITEDFKLKGKVHVQLVDEFGRIKKEQTTDNLVVTTGKAFVASALIAVPAITFTHIGLGSSNTAVAVGQTALITELSSGGYARQAATTSNPTSVTTLFAASFGPGVGTGTIEEMGIFSAVTAGTMFSRYLSGTYVKAAGDTLTVSWTITVS